MTVEELINRLDDGICALERIAESVAPPPEEPSWQMVTFLMPMDDYEIANLRAGLETLRALGLDTGDWLGQLLIKLQQRAEGRKPNVEVADQVKRAHVRRKS